MNQSPANNKDNTEEETKTCKQRFKGVETFLRRIAFNLGNSPSQTEVKIISCIPIDVTDLQNKIITLERQLLDARNTKSSTKNPPVVKPVPEQSIRNTNAVLSCQYNEVPLGLVETRETNTMPPQCGNVSMKHRKSAVSLLYPTVSSTGLQQNRPCLSNETWDERNSQNINSDENRKRFFRRCKKKKPFKQKQSPKTQLVYYAQTENIPFNNYAISPDLPFVNCSKPNIDKAFSNNYLSNVIQKHFNPECVVEEFSDTSHFTSPVCRDLYNGGCCRYESDVCSCCHGQFQDIDKYLGKYQNFLIEPISAHRHNQFDKGIYYDSTLYDLVPVKEKTTKIQKYDKIPIREQKRAVDTRCWPETARSKLCYETTAMYHQTKPNTKYTKSGHKKTSKRHRNNMINKRTGSTDNSYSCCVDCSEIYPKPLFVTPKVVKEEKESARPIFRKNAECLTIDIDAKNLTITRSIQIDINSTETKTEETLNQIKNILQSVLAEVKTNPQLNNPPEIKLQKDAVIQKGSSQSNMQENLSLLRSFTYNNSFNANPYLPSCSHQIPSNFCYTNVPFQRRNCTQNFPLLVQTPGHQKCGCFFKHTSQRNIVQQKQAATTATNTEVDNQETQSRETDKLIKEIYKSIALTIESAKETSNSEYDELKSVTNNSNNASDTKDLRTIVAMAEAQKRDIEIEASMTPLSTTTVRSNYNNNLRDAKSYVKWNKVELDYDSQSTDHENFEKPEPKRGVANVASTISEHYSEELSSDNESVERLEILEDVKNKTEKKGLLKRMLGSVKLFNKKKQHKRKAGQNLDVMHEIENEKSESDSDDYQTIYSEKINTPKQNFNKSNYYKPRSHVTPRALQQKTVNQTVRGKRRSPYMEQEYRRQWNEQLMFQGDGARRYSSERPYSYQQTPVYWQNYDARSAMVDHHTPYQSTYEPVRATPIKPVINKIERRTSPLNIADRKDGNTKFNWLKKHKLGISQCGEQWKKFILEN